jgi:hypothetical protein
MAIVDDLWLAALTRNEDDTGSNNRFNLTINVNGDDVVGKDFALAWGLSGRVTTVSRRVRPDLRKATPCPHRSIRTLLQTLRSGWGSGATMPGEPNTFCC